MPEDACGELRRVGRLAMEGVTAADGAVLVHPDEQRTAVGVGQARHCFNQSPFIDVCG